MVFPITRVFTDSVPSFLLLIAHPGCFHTWQRFFMVNERARYSVSFKYYCPQKKTWTDLTEKAMKSKYVLIVGSKRLRFLLGVQTRRFHLGWDQVTLNFLLFLSHPAGLSVSCQLTEAVVALQHQLFPVMLVGWMKGTPSSTPKKSEDGDEYDSTESGQMFPPTPVRRGVSSGEKRPPPASQRPSWSSPLSRGVADVTGRVDRSSRQPDAALTDSLACLRGTDGSGAGLAANAEGGALSRRPTCRFRCARADGTLALLLFPRAHCWTLRKSLINFSARSFFFFLPPLPFLSSRPLPLCLTLLLSRLPAARYLFSICFNLPALYLPRSSSLCPATAASSSAF